MLQMSKAILSRCPYCGKKISYINSMFLRKQGEYYCYKCQCTSNIVIHRGLYALASAVCVISFLIMLLFSMFGNHEDLRGMMWVVIPFMVFYIAVPFFIRLEPFNDKIYPQKRKPKAVPVGQPKVRKVVRKKPAPVELQVDDDFSKKFMQAKSNAVQKVHSPNEDNNITGNLPRDIGNTQILFELNSKNNDSDTQ